LLSVSLPPPEDPEFCVVARHEDRLGRGRWLAFALLAASTGVIGVCFLAAGAWPVLPWTLVELAGLAVAFHLIGRRARDWERLVVRGDRVIVERSVRGAHERREFNRWWLRVEIDPAGGERDPHLTLRFAGEAMHFGNALPAARRIEVARTLRRLTSCR
jgi:uncharacterized membrane protein